jgi:hypothetical protein
LADQQNRLRSLLISAAKDISASLSSPSEQQKSDDTDDYYFGFSRQSSVNDDVETTTSSANKQELEVMHFLEERHSCTSLLPYAAWRVLASITRTSTLQSGTDITFVLSV